MTYKPNPTKADAGETYVVSQDLTVQELLREILRQIVIANMQLSSMTGEELITDETVNPTGLD